MRFKVSVKEQWLVMKSSVKMYFLLHLQYVTDVWRNTSVKLLEKQSEHSSSQRDARFKEWKIQVACQKEDRDIRLCAKWYGIWGTGMYWSVTCHNSMLEASPSHSKCDPVLLASQFLASSLKLPIIESIAVIVSFIWTFVHWDLTLLKLIL